MQIFWIIMAKTKYETHVRVGICGMRDNGLRFRTHPRQVRKRRKGLKTFFDATSFSRHFGPNASRRFTRERERNGMELEWPKNNPWRTLCSRAGLDYAMHRNIRIYKQARLRSHPRGHTLHPNFSNDNILTIVHTLIL